MMEVQKPQSDSQNEAENVFPGKGVYFAVSLMVSFVHQRLRQKLADAVYEGMQSMAADGKTFLDIAEGDFMRKHLWDCKMALLSGHVYCKDESETTWTQLERNRKDAVADSLMKWNGLSDLHLQLSCEGRSRSGSKEWRVPRGLPKILRVHYVPTRLNPRRFADLNIIHGSLDTWYEPSPTNNDQFIDVGPKAYRYTLLMSVKIWPDGLTAVHPYDGSGKPIRAFPDSPQWAVGEPGSEYMLYYLFSKNPSSPTWDGAEVVQVDPVSHPASLVAEVPRQPGTAEKADQIYKGEIMTSDCDTKMSEESGQATTDSNPDAPMTVWPPVPQPPTEVSRQPKPSKAPTGRPAVSIDMLPRPTRPAWKSRRVAKALARKRIPDKGRGMDREGGREPGVDPTNH